MGKDINSQFLKKRSTVGQLRAEKTFSLANN